MINRNPFANDNYYPDLQLIPGVAYGSPDKLLSPAYWAQRCREGEATGHDFISRGSTLHEEIGFCLLGGFGVTLEINEAFYRHLLINNVFMSESDISEEKILSLLNMRIPVAGRLHKYRFPRQRARRIYLAMKHLDELDLDLTDGEKFRSQIEQLDGIGPKTASWIARNWLGAENVAILDIHVLRAGWAINLFEKNCVLPRDYSRLEKRFLDFAKALKVRASVLDAVMWSDMRTFGSKLVSNI